MRKKCYHFFGGLLNAQANWLNKMSEKGYRLIRAGKMLYEFEECKPNEVKYCVEFIGEKSKENTKPIKNISAIPMIPTAGLLFVMRPLTLPVCWQRGGNGKSPLNI